VDETLPAQLGRIQGGPARVLEEEVLEAQVPRLDSVLAVSDVLDDSSAMPAADPCRCRHRHRRHRRL